MSAPAALGKATSAAKAAVGGTAAAAAQASEQAQRQAKKVLASEKAQAATTAARGAAESAIQQVANATPDGVKQATHRAKKAAGNVIADSRQRAKRKQEQWRLMLETWIKQKLHRRIEQLVERLPAMAKEMLEDPEMPRCVSRSKDSLIDSIWPDIQEEILWETCLRLDGEADDDLRDDAQHTCCCVCAFFRYNLFPHDKSFWGCLRNPIWVLFQVGSNLPITGACAAAYLLIFLIIDKTDKYQLVHFIMSFKGTQFISFGILRALVGFFFYVACVTAPAREAEHSCEENGPGTGGFFLIMIGGFLLQVLLVWLAFFLLSCSQENGRRTLKGAIKFERSVGTSSVYLRRLMLYDLACFVLCFGVVSYVSISRAKIDDWVVSHITFACQVVYGYLALPFFFLKMPLTTQALVHVVPTAYDRNGRCCKPIGYKHGEKLPQDDDIIEDSEAVSLRDRLKALLNAPSTSADDGDEEVDPEEFRWPARDGTE